MGKGGAVMGSWEQNTPRCLGLGESWTRWASQVKKPPAKQEMWLD